MIYIDLRRFASDIGDIRYINANTMPTHADKMDKTGGNPSCVVHSESMCWHCVGMPQLRRLLVITYGQPTEYIIYVLVPIELHIISYMATLSLLSFGDSFVRGGCLMLSLELLI